jgi:metal-responsive CopG/Arc/MetJ family transcriptional regulator
METIQVVLDSELLRATDHAARKARVNRSALVRKALREHLKRIRIQEMEAQEREGYRKHPQDPDEIAAWEQIAAWPEE